MQRKNFYLTLLALTLGMASSINALAQVSIPTPAGRWTFDDTSDLLKKEGGGMSLTPCTVSGTTVTTKDNAAQANITATTGSTSANKAVKIPAASALKVNRANGAVATKNYTIMMDVKVANANPYCSLLQTGDNSNDGDLFFHENKIGSSQLGDYSGAIISNGTWHRVVLTRRGDNNAYVFVDGTLVLTRDFTGTNHDGKYTLDGWGFYLFCDNDGEKQDADVAEVAYWETGLSDEQVAALSTYKSYICDGVTYDISNAAGLKNLADFTNAGYNTVNARLVSDVSMSGESWPKPIGDWSTNDVRTAYKGHFDGQGHTISNLSYTTAQNYHGLFGVVSTGADIENFTVSGTIRNASYNQFGAVGFARDNGVSLRNIHSCLDIINTGEQKTIGGILGHVYNNSTVSIDRCTYSGTLQVTDTGGDGGMYGGILGHAYNNANANISITNCLFDGTIRNNGTATGSSYPALGGITGWIGTNVPYSINDCLSIGTVTSVSPRECGQFCGALMNDGGSFSNNYYKGSVVNGIVSEATKTATSVTDERLSSGEICYLLNGSIQGGTNWYQTIGTDANPVPYSTSDKVFLYGSSYVSENDVVNIGNATDLTNFAAIVNAGGTSLNGVLTANIDLDSIAWTPIGTETNKYSGTFDGKGKAITNFNYTSTGRGGLFGHIQNATVKDFSIDGTLTVTSGSSSGVIGKAGLDATYDTSVISDIHSTLTVNVTQSDVHHVGGVVGWAYGSININRCSFAGSMSVVDGNIDSFAGVVGYTYMNTIRNCANYGNIIFHQADCKAGGILGYMNNTGTAVRNCLNMGTIAHGGGSPTYGGAIIGHLNNNHDATKLTNNYWLEGSGNGVSAGNVLSTETNPSVSTAQLASGEVAYKLNENSVYEPNWFQTIGTDDNPVLSNTHGIVNKISAAGYTTQYIPGTDVTIPDGVEAYTGVILSEGWLHLNAIENGKIAAGEAVILKGNEGYYSFVPTTDAEEVEGNVLKGSDGTITGGDGIYALAKKGNPAVVGFYSVDSDVPVPAGKVYLDSDGSLVKVFKFAFDDDDATGINSPLLTSPEEEGQVYNLAGQRISKLQKGINIINGKKVLK